MQSGMRFASTASFGLVQRLSEPYVQARARGRGPLLPWRILVIYVCADAAALAQGYLALRKSARGTLK